jgi:hypothetical protein
LTFARTTPENLPNFISRRFDNEKDASGDYDDEEESDDIKVGNIRELFGEDHGEDSAQGCDRESEIPEKTYLGPRNYGNTCSLSVGFQIFVPRAIRPIEKKHLLRMTLDNI